MGRIVSTIIIFLALMSISQADEDLVHLVGLDETGKEINLPVKSRLWRKRIAKVFNRVGGDVLPAIETYESNEKFSFSQFDFGLYIPMKFGIGVLDESPVSLKMKVEPYFKLFFKKKNRGQK